MDRFLKKIIQKVNLAPLMPTHLDITILKDGLFENPSKKKEKIQNVTCYNMLGTLRVYMLDKYFNRCHIEIVLIFSRDRFAI